MSLPRSWPEQLFRASSSRFSGKLSSCKPGVLHETAPSIVEDSSLPSDPTYSHMGFESHRTRLRGLFSLRAFPRSSSWLMKIARFDLMFRRSVTCRFLDGNESYKRVRKSFCRHPQLFLRGSTTESSVHSAYRRARLVRSRRFLFAQPIHRRDIDQVPRRGFPSPLAIVAFRAASV